MRPGTASTGGSTDLGPSDAVRESRPREPSTTGCRPSGVSAEGTRPQALPGRPPSAATEGPPRDEPVRAHGTASQYAPEPLLAGVAGLTLAADESDVAGAFDAEIAGGPYYEYLIGAERVDGNGRVEPQTVAGQWYLGEWIGSYYRTDGRVYRGIEVQQTDAGFFSTDAYYVLDLSPDESASGPTLDVRPVPGAVRSALDDGLARGVEKLPGTSSPSFTVGPNLPGAALSFARETDYVLTHTTLLSVAAGSGGEGS